jgi:DNA-binding MarR family transcriptional regulator
LTINDKDNTKILLESFRQFQKLHWNKRNIDNLKPSETFLLFSIHKLLELNSQGIKISDISKHLGIAPPSVTQLVNSLEEKMFLVRSQDSSDRRSVRVKLGVEGENLIKKINTNFYNSFKGLVEFLGPEDSQKLSELMKKTYVFFSTRDKISGKDTE